MAHVVDKRVGGRLGLGLERLARWWSSASQAERFECVRRSINGEAEAPPLKTLHLAIYLAEAEAGEIGEG